MGTRGQIIFGLFLVFLGLIYILGIVFDLDAGALCWPVLLIILGVWLLARPRLERGGSNVILIGDFRRRVCGMSPAPMYGLVLVMFISILCRVKFRPVKPYFA
jgi:hypothetical protein